MVNAEIRVLHCGHSCHHTVRALYTQFVIMTMTMTMATTIMYMCVCVFMCVFAFSNFVIYYLNFCFFPKRFNDLLYLTNLKTCYAYMMTLFNAILDCSRCLKGRVAWQILGNAICVFFWTTDRKRMDLINGLIYMVSVLETD